MGAIVTVRVQPGTDAAAIQSKLENELTRATGEPVRVIVNIIERSTPQVQTIAGRPYIKQSESGSKYM